MYVRMYTFWNTVVGVLNWEEATLGCRLHLAPAPITLCLNMARLSSVSLWVCESYLSCSAKHPASYGCKAAGVSFTPSPFG